MSQQNYISNQEKKRLFMKNEELNIYFDKVEIILKNDSEVREANLIISDGERIFIIVDNKQPAEQQNLILSETDLKNNTYTLKSINIYTIDKEMEKIERNIALQHPKGITSTTHPFNLSYIDDYLNLKNFCIGKMKDIILEHYNDYKGNLDISFKTILKIELDRKLSVPKNEFIDSFAVLREGYINREILRNNQEINKETINIKKQKI